MAQKKKSKTSSVKKSNQLRTKLTKQGKLKKKINRKNVLRKQKPTPVPIHDDSAGDSSGNEDDLVEMMEEDDISFLKKAAQNQSYSLFSNLNIKSNQRKRKLERENDDKVEEDYEKEIEQPDMKKKKYLLPIKTSKGFVQRSVDIEESDEDLEVEPKHVKTVEDKGTEMELLFGQKMKDEISTAELLASRQRALQRKKFRIGILASGLLENPEAKINNFKPLIDMLDEKDAEVCITVKKLALISLLEIFKDLLPEYQIKHHDDPKVRLKKDVKQLHDYENSLVRAYKLYLKKIEKIISILRKKKGDKRVFKEPEMNIAEMALQSLCDLLISRMNFNFSKNIIHLLAPYLNHPKEGIRTIVVKTVRDIFKADKRGEITLEIVRNINKLVKSKNYSVNPDVLKVFLSLKLKDINLDSEKEAELKKKKLSSKRGNLLSLSKRERKRGKRLEELQKEFLETKAEENVKAKQQVLTEVTKVVFLIYFNILKVAPSSKLLNAALEGLAKFAHCINIEFYHDLILVLDNLIENENLGYKEQLCCVQTVFTILSHQGTSINIDPLRFYTYLYVNLFSIHAGRNHADLPIILKASDAVLVKRRKQISIQRLLAFLKRLSTLALHVLPNGSLGLLCVVKGVLQGSKTTEILLENDSSTGQGVYFPELDEPEFCNANATSLWELLPLQRHYHPTVQDYAQRCAKVDRTGDEVGTSKGYMRKSPEQLFKEFDGSEVKFNPAVPAPRKFPKKYFSGRGRILNDELKRFIEATLPEEEAILQTL